MPGVHAWVQNSTRSCVGLIFILYRKINTEGHFSIQQLSITSVVNDSVKTDTIFTDLPIVLVKRNSI